MKNWQPVPVGRSWNILLICNNALSYLSCYFHTCFCLATASVGSNNLSREHRVRIFCWTPDCRMLKAKQNNEFLTVCLLAVQEHVRSCGNVVNGRVASNANKKYCSSFCNTFCNNFPNMFLLSANVKPNSAITARPTLRVQIFRVNESLLFHHTY